MRFYLDAPTSWDFPSRSVIVRGWCFSPGRGGIQGVRLSLPGYAVPCAVGLPRPDVRAAVPEAPDDSTGFEVRATLPGGTFPVVLEAQEADGSWVTLARHRASCPRWRRPFWLGGGTNAELVAFQLAAHAQHAPRPVRLEKFPRPRLASETRLRIAVVTPSLNQARYLQTCMASVQSDAATAVDYVVQDGGSRDGSMELIRRHAARLQAWESVPDHGQADAVMKGFAKTAGRPDDLMAWINSDDFYLPGALAFVADYFARHPEVDVVYGHRIMVDEESREIGRWFLPHHDDAVLRWNDFVPQETLFWRRRIWDRVGGLDTSFQFAMDWDLLLRFQEAGARMVRIPFFLACFRIHAAQKTSSLMRTTGQKEIDRLRARANGREIPPAELENHPRLIHYLRRSAWIGQLWKLRIRAR
jgi:GT2 family glycosyltransferase